MFVRLFVDENLDRMVPISKQPKEKIQAIIESCSRQFPEFQERARKRIRTYLKSCRRMKKNGMEMTRPTPPHLTSAMAENILAAACESETRKAAKRMRLEIYQSSQVCAHAGCMQRGLTPRERSLAIPSTPAGRVDREVGGQPSCSLQLQHYGGQRGWRKEGAKRWVGSARGPCH